MAILGTLDLIPDDGSRGVERVHSKEELPRSSKSESGPRLSFLGDDQAAIAASGPKKVVMLPPFHGRKAVKTLTGLDLPVEFNQFAYCGKWSEIWFSSARTVAVIRRSDQKIYLFDETAYNRINAYITEARRRGVTMSQATDIICNELIRCNISKP